MVIFTAHGYSQATKAMRMRRAQKAQMASHHVVGECSID